MFKVKSLSSRYALATHDACSNLISCEVNDESPTRYDFDITQLLDNNEVNLNEQSSDIKYLKKPDSDESCTALSKHPTASSLSSWNTDNETSVLELLQEADNQGSGYINPKGMAPNNKENTVVNYASLSSFSEHHLKLGSKPQVLKNSMYNSDTPLDDLLADNCSSNDSSKKYPNSLGLLFSEGSYNLPKLPSDSEKKSYDLSVLPDSRGTSIFQSSDVSLADLANNHFLSNSPKSNDNTLEELLLVDNVYNSGHDFDLTNNIISDLSSVNSDVSSLEELSLADLLKTDISWSKFENCSKDVKIPLKETSNKTSHVNLNSCSLYDILDVGNTVNLCESQKKDENILPDTNSSDDEIVPDIDLNFCIRKPSSFSTESYALTSSSLESTDSGFDETDFMPLKSNPISQNFVSFESAYSPVKELQSSLLNQKESLLSKAISCKPNFNKTKSEKLKKIKKDLFMKHFPESFMDCNRQCLTIYDAVEDHSNQCVMMMNSRFNV